MVLTDDNFTTIVEAVRRAGHRRQYRQIRAVPTVHQHGGDPDGTGRQPAGLAPPFTAIQILWINIIMDGPPAMSLGVEPAREGVMDEPPRQANTRILSGARFTRLFAYGLTMAIGTLALFHYAQPGAKAMH